jgi:tetratricopeptide (TPR) repeat protein
MPISGIADAGFRARIRRVVRNAAMALAVAGCVHRPAVKPPVDHGQVAFRRAVASCDAGEKGSEDDYAAAEAACGLVIKSPLASPADAGRALRNRAGIYVLDEKYAEALTDYTALLQAAPNDRAILLALARTDMKIGRCAAAAQRYGELLKLAPKRSDALEARGDALVCMKQDENAVRDFTAALALRPRASLYDKRAASYLRLGEPDQALQDFTASLALHPHNAVALAGQGAIALDRNDYAGALQDDDAAMQAGLTTAEIVYGHGAANLALQNYAAAAADFDRALKLNHKLAKAYDARATALMRQGDYDKALQDYSQLIAMNKQDASAYVHRGQIYGFKGDYERAIADYTEAIDIDPNLLAALASRGDAYMARGQYDLAIADFARGQKLAPNDKGFTERLRKGKAELAKQQAVKGISIEATYPKH